MQISLYQREVFAKYKSNSQRIRVLTENWMTNNMFCPRCLNPRISPFPNNNPVADFSCPKCEEQYQLKSQKSSFGKKINDGAYGTMLDSIAKNIRPNFFLLHYDLDYFIKNLFLIPGFFFVPKMIERRKPLAESAQRAGWTGCNILLEKVPPEGRIVIINEGVPTEKEFVARQWKKIDFIKSSPLSERGWMIDVLKAVHSLNKKKFTLQEIYRLEEGLSKGHPQNQHVREKIRQQLQVLRDRGLLRFLGNGDYELV